MLEKFSVHLPVILAVLLAISESLALNPNLKSNGILDLVIKVLKTLKEQK